MYRTAGHVVWHTSRVLHLLIVMANSLLFGVSLALVALAFRLSLGPINMGWMGALIDNSFVLNDRSVGLSFQNAALAWDGFQHGVGLPLDLRLTDVRVTDAGGQDVATARHAFVSLALGPLFLGHFVPRTVELADGIVTISMQRGGTPGLPIATEQPPTDTAHAVRPVKDPDLSLSLGEFIHRSDVLGQLDHVRLRNFQLQLRGPAAAIPWQASLRQLELVRQAGGIITGSVQLPFTFDGQPGELALRANLPRIGDGKVEATLTPVQPASFAKVVPSLSFLAGLQAAASIDATMTITHDLVPVDGQADIHLDAGKFDFGSSQISIQNGIVALSGTPDHLVIDDARLTLPAARTGTSTVLSLNGRVDRAADRTTAAVNVAIDDLDVADLPSLWPAGIGGGARPWVTQNVTAGFVSHASAALVAEAGTDFHDVTLTQATADLDADNVSITWLDPVPPINRARVHLHLIDPDQLIITVPSAHQRISGGGADLMIQDGRMLITGLSVRDQDTQITLRTDGPISSAMSLLKEPRLKILSKHPVGFPDPTGDASVTISLQFPLENKLQPEQIVFQIGAHLEKVRIPALVAGRDLTDGILDLAADKDGLTMKGQGTLAAIPLTVSGFMDFNAGPPNQVLQRITASGQPTIGQLAAAGINVQAVLTSGAVPLTATFVDRRNGEESIALNADLGPSSMQLRQAGWSKQPGVAATAAATIVLNRDRLTSVQNIAVDSNDLSIAGSVNCPDGIIRSITLDRAKIGRTDVWGAIQFPANRPIDVALSGPQIDLSPLLENSTGRDTSQSKQTPDWSLNGRFDRVLLAHGEKADHVAAQASMVNSALRSLDVTGSLASGSAFSARIGPAGGTRTLTVDAADAGALFRASGLTTSIRSGSLRVRGSYDDLSPRHPLSGTAELDDSRLVDAPLIGKLLQAVTLYGLADLMSGPGIGVTHVVAPFRYEDQRLTINDSRMFSSSLGATAKGLIDLSSDRLSMSGTLVPAYMINSALGRIPFVGRLFSPEVGGGLFAARYGIDGPFDNPNISVNPLSVLTPGFLRDLFDIGSTNP